MSEIRFKIGLDGYSLTKQQLEDLNASLKKLGTTVEKQPGLARAILGGMGARPTPPVIGAGATPPPIPRSGSGIDWRTALMSAAISPFSPWVASRGLAQSLGPLVGSVGGGGGGKGGGIWGSGGFGGFLQWLLALEVAGTGLRLVFEHLAQVVEKGAKLFEQSAEVGKQPGNLFALQHTLGPLGISPDQLARLMVRGENPLKSGGRTMSLTDSLLGAGRGIMQMGELQRITNMREYIDLLGKEVGVDATVMQHVSQGLFNLKVEWEQLSREWNTLWSDIAEAIGPMLILVMQNLRRQLETVNFVLDGLRQFENSIFPQLGLAKILSGYPQGGLSNMQTGGFGSGAQAGHVSAWERMGFVMSGGVSDTMERTAENTRQIAQNTQSISEKLSNGYTFNPLMPFGGGYPGNNP